MLQLALPVSGAGWAHRQRFWILALPQLTEESELPAGVYPAPLSEVRARFGVGSARRKTLILRLERIYRVAQATGHLARFVVFGSFVTGSWSLRTSTCSLSWPTRSTLRS